MTILPAGQSVRERAIDRTRDRLVRLPEVRNRTGLSTATIYRKVDRGEFPAKIPIGANSVAWYESDLGAWIADPIGWGRKVA